MVSDLDLNNFDCEDNNINVDFETEFNFKNVNVDFEIEPNFNDTCEEVLPELQRLARELNINRDDLLDILNNDI